MPKISWTAETDCVDLRAKPGWKVEIQREIGFKDKFKLYIHDDKGQTVVRVCQLDNDQFELAALL